MREYRRLLWGYSTTVITTDTDLENKSNLLKMVSLSHELIHAYMFDFLQDEGIIYFNNNGQPMLDIICDDGTDYANINLNNLNIRDRFSALLCAIVQADPTNQNWTHELFNSPTFEITDYRTALEQLIINENDWDNETNSFKNDAINVFGANDWKTEVARAVSWIGLEGTTEYTDYLSNYEGAQNIFKLNFIVNIGTKIQNANSNCQ